MTKLHPFIKYTGSKFPYLTDLKVLLPENYKNVFIPFVGSGSFITLFENKPIVASDLNSDVISVFKALVDNPKLLYRLYKTHYITLTQNIKGKGYYYNLVRDRFNLTRNPEDFLFLTRTCYNGLIRYNKRGDFNVGFHHTRDGITPDKLRTIIYTWLTLLTDTNKVDFYHEDYRSTIVKAIADDFIIADPPYIKTKGQYLAQKFDFAEFEYLFNSLTKKGVKWMITLDDDLSLVKQTLPNLYGNYQKTSEKQSSLSNLKNKKVHKGNTVITNY